MARLAFTCGRRFLLHQQVYVVRERPPTGALRLENLTFGGAAPYLETELVALWEQGQLVFEVGGAGGQPSVEQPLATGYTLADFQALADSADPRDRYRYLDAWHKYTLLLPLLRLPPAARTRAAIIAYAATLPVPNPPQQGRVPLGQAQSARSLERWLRAFEDGGWDIRALVAATNRQGGGGRLRLDAALEGIIAEVFAACAARPQVRTVEEVYLAVVNAVALENRQRAPAAPLLLPARMTIHRRLRATDSSSILRRRRSRLAEQAAALVLPGPQPTRILERVEADHTILDLCVVDLTDRLPIGRPTLTLLRDAYSAVPVGFYVGFEPPSYHTIALALLHAILPKPDAVARYGTRHPWPAYCYGLPETLVVDNGKEFIGHDLADACAQLGIVREQMPVRTPWWKGAIERQFRSTNTGLVHSLPGSTFATLLERGVYDPARDACISLEAFWQMLHIYFLDYEMQKWHEGVGGVPAQRWAASIQEGFLPALPHSATETRILLYRTETRTIQRTGIDFEGLRYQSPALTPIRTALPAGTAVRLKYNPADLGTIYVADPAPGGSWVAVPALDAEYAQGLSLWKHRVIRDYARREQHAAVAITDLAAAKAQIQAVVEEEFRHTRKQRGRKQAARFLGVTAEAAPHPAAPAALPAPPDVVVATPPESHAPARSRRTRSPVIAPGAAVPEAVPAVPPVAPDVPDPLLEGWGSSYVPPLGKRADS